MVDLDELKEYIKENIDETLFLELLDLSIEELVEAFEDRIAEKQSDLVNKLELE